MIATMSVPAAHKVTAATPHARLSTKTGAFALGISCIGSRSASVSILILVLVYWFSNYQLSRLEP